MTFKYLKSVAVVSCLFIATSLTALASPASAFAEEVVTQTSKSTSHTVAKGETLYSIAKMYNVSIADMYSANPGVENGIRIGDVLKIPGNSKATAVATTAAATGTARSHAVKSKETLYSISKLYGIKVEDVIDANPELRSKPLYEGQVLRIPRVANLSHYTTKSSKSTSVSSQSQFISHKVGAKETLYGIARQYNTTPEALIDFNPDIKSGLREGTTIVVPVLESPKSQVNTLQNVNTLNVALVLPFVNKSEQQGARFIEYYEGFLLALKEMKSKGLSVNVYTFDMGSETGTTKLKSLLDTYEMKYLDMIIGGISSEQITVISDFAKKQGIKYVIPFPTKVDEVRNNSQVFQINAPHSTLYANVAKTFTNSFKSANVIYITEANGGGDRTDFISALNQELPRAGMLANTLAADYNLGTSLLSALDRGRKNVIVPTSASTKMLQNILPVLNNIIAENPHINVSLFGHTDWQTYPQYFNDYAKFDTYIYTPFYLSENDYRAKQFVTDYQKWYNDKSLINTYPKYGVLGYDTGIAFLSALQKYGKDFDKHVNGIAVSSLQTPFLFKKENPSGGYMNTGFYLVHYRKDGSVDKTECGR